MKAARRIAFALLGLLALGSARSASADEAPAAVYAHIQAHPAMWTVHGPKGTVYLLGSIHILPPLVDWRTKEIAAAIARADVFVFELLMDAKFQAAVTEYVRTRGMLPAGQHLRDMLDPAARVDFDTAIAGLPVNPAALDRMRPWLATLTIDVAAMTKQHYSSQAGIDIQLQQEKSAQGKTILGLETLEQQLTLLAPTDPKLELQAFEADLKSTNASGDQVGPLLDAWMQGDTHRLARLTWADIKAYPLARKLLFDDRNKAWVKQIVGMLNQDKTYFITVGAGHLLGARGVPALLRAKGYRVDGPR